MHKLGDALYKPRLVYLIWYLRYNYSRMIRFVLLYFGACAHDDASAARSVGLLHACRTHDYSARREIRPLDVRHKLLDAYFGIVYHCAKRVRYLAKIVRRYV